MEIQEILKQVERAAGVFPREALEAAAARRDEITPELLRVLRDTIDRAAELEADPDYMAHFYAMFLLAQFREVRAYPLVVEFASLPARSCIRCAAISSLKISAECWRPSAEAIPAASSL